MCQARTPRESACRCVQLAAERGVSQSGSDSSAGFDLRDKDCARGYRLCGRPGPSVWSGYLSTWLVACEC